MPALEESVSDIYQNTVSLFFAVGELSKRCNTEELDLVSHFTNNKPATFRCYGLFSSAVADGIGAGVGIAINMLAKKHSPDFSGFNLIQLIQKINTAVMKIETNYSKNLQFGASDYVLSMAMRQALQSDLLT